MTATTIKSTLFVLIAAFSFVFPSFYVAADNTKQMSESIFEVNNASQFVKPSLLNKKQTVRTNDSKEEIKYLGTIKNTRGKILYYVLTVYSEV